MHIHTLKNWQHSHDFSVTNERGEQRTQAVLALTVVTMLAEIVAGNLYGSMALLADGWHMGTHVAAFVIALFAYRYARRHAKDPAYTFGTGKVNALGGFASAIALAIVALIMLVESLHRIVQPEAIQFNEAIAVATIGLAVNIASVWLLKDAQHHHHTHDHAHGHGHHHHHHHDQDQNLRAAYLHVLADAMTSLLAIVALLFGKYLGWNWLDPIMGIVGAIVIVRWSLGLVNGTGPILLDASIPQDYRNNIRAAIEGDSDNRISDLHIWKVGPDSHAAIIALVTHFPQPVTHYKALLDRFHDLAHITIEVNACPGEPCIVPEPHGT